MFNVVPSKIQNFAPNQAPRKVQSFPPVSRSAVSSEPWSIMGSFGRKKFLSFDGSAAELRHLLAKVKVTRFTVTVSIPIIPFGLKSSCHYSLVSASQQVLTSVIQICFCSLRAIMGKHRNRSSPTNPNASSIPGPKTVSNASHFSAYEQTGKAETGSTKDYDTSSVVSTRDSIGDLSQDDDSKSRPLVSASVPYMGFEQHLPQFPLKYVSVRQKLLTTAEHPNVNYLGVHNP